MRKEYLSWLREVEDRLRERMLLRVKFLLFLCEKKSLGMQPSLRTLKAGFFLKTWKGAAAFTFPVDEGPLSWGEGRAGQG